MLYNNTTVCQNIRWCWPNMSDVNVNKWMWLKVHWKHLAYSDGKIRSIHKIIIPLQVMHLNLPHRRTRRGSGGAAARPAWNISGQTMFSGQAQPAEKSWMMKNISIQWIQGTLCFARQAQSCSKFLNGEKNLSTVYSVCSHLGVICTVWVSVVCNLDQRRDWL